MLSNDTRALLPGTVTVFCGSPGATKSLALIHAVRHWTHDEIRVAALELEDGAAYHLRRALAQIAGEANLTDDGWCRGNPQRVDELHRAASSELHAMESCIEAPSDGKGGCVSAK